MTAPTVTLAYQQLDETIEPGRRSPAGAEAEGGRRRAAQHPGHGLRLARRRRQRHRRPDRHRRSDTTILVHVSGDRKQVYGVSLPRDALVTRPDCDGRRRRDRPRRRARDLQRRVRRSAARPARSQRSHALTGVYIDHYVVGRLQRLQGHGRRRRRRHGLHPRGVDDPEHDIYFEAGHPGAARPAGAQLRARALELSANADIGRMKRQQAFIASMINKVISAETLTQAAPRLQVRRRGDRLDHRRPRPRVAGQARQARAAVPRDRPRRHRVHHRAVHGLRAEPEPAGLGARGRRSSGSGSSPTSRSTGGSSEVIDGRRPGRARRPAPRAARRPASRQRPAGWRRRRDETRATGSASEACWRPVDSDARPAGSARAGSMPWAARAYWDGRRCW